ncbi:MAG: yrrB 7 [Gemmataceae bacterium]|nr:yrrB 7 [Gemmataceae bacterium]
MHDILQAAIAHHQAGRLDQAERLYHDLLKVRPDHPDALHLLGVVSHQRGVHHLAVEQIGRAVALNPGVAAYHVNLAEACRAAGDPGRAADHCREALRLQPDSAEAQCNLGLALGDLGRTDEAIAAYEAAIGFRPYWPLPYRHAGEAHRAAGFPYRATAVCREGLRLCGAVGPLHLGLARVLVELVEPEQALFHCQEAARLLPEEPEAQLQLGHALAALGRLADARARYELAAGLAPALGEPPSRLGLIAQAEGRLDEALQLAAEAARREPANPQYHCQVASVLYEKDRPDQALTRYREVIRNRPDFAEAHNSLGYILQDQGDVPGALAAYRDAVRVRPAYADAYLNLGLLLTEVGELDQGVAAFREALRHDPDHPEALSGLAVSLRDRLPAEEEAACERALARGRMSARRRAVLQYGLAQVMDARGHFGRAAALAARANAALKEEARRLGQGFDPGEHRAYVDQIVGAYPPAHFERTRGWGLDTEVPVFVLGLPRSGTSLVEQVLASHPQVFGAGELNFVRDIYRSLPGLVGRSAPGIACAGDLTADQVRALAGGYLDRVRGLAPAAARIVDKMPDNYLMVGLIATLFPNAVIIHTRRDVRDVGLSCWLTHFKHIRWACDLEHIGVRVREYLRLMDHWRQVLPGRMLEVDYEEVVADLEPAARRLLDRVGLPWDPACLEFYRTKRVVRTASMTQVREPVYRRSVNRWVNYRTVLGPMLAAIGGSEERAP